MQLSKQAYRTLSRCILALLHVILLASCAGEQPAETKRVFLIRGEITDSVLDSFKKSHSLVDTVVITSGGGKTISAIPLGEIIFDNKMKVIVEGYCLSACAQWILPAAAEIEIKGEALVGFHHTASAFQDTLNRRSDFSNFPTTVQLAALEKAYYQIIGVSEKLLVYPYAQTEPFCYFEATLGNKRGPTLGARFDFVAIPKSHFEKSTGRTVNGSWAESATEIREAIATHIPPERNLLMIPDDPLKLPSNERLSLCEDYERLITMSWQASIGIS